VVREPSEGATVRYLLTGASGFLGAWTARALLRAGHEVVALTRTGHAWRLAGLAGLGTVTAPNAEWPDAVAGIRPDVLIALDWAGVAGPERDGPEQGGNVDRLDALAEAAITSGAQRIVGIGSQAEYGWQAGPISEESARTPTSAYGKAKAAALDRIRERCGRTQTEWAWARVFSVYGPLDNDGNVLARVAAALRGGHDLDLSSGAQPWSYLFASDAARALAVVAEPGRPVGIVNVAHPDAPALRDSISTFAASVTPANGTLRFSDENGPALEADVSRLIAMGWRPEVSSTTGLGDTARWFSGIPVTDPLLGGVLPARAEA
jgi:nucleoside-diphosphate-sugar epimerase